MVVFSCNGCGEMLKKNQVDAHAARCRSCSSVSCIDCSVTFYGDDFRLHTSCITEAERYEKSVYRGGGNKRAKKRNPQEAWMDLIVAASSTAPVSIRRHMETLASLDNVPRKPKQFRNFTANSLNLRGKQATSIVDSLWNHLSELRAKEQESKAKEQDEENRRKEQEKNEDQDKECKDCHGDAPPQQLKKSNAADDVSRKGINEGKDVSAKKVKKAMKKALKKAPGRKMKLKELRRAVRSYLECGDSCKTKVKQLIGEQLVDSDAIRVDGKLVLLR